MSDIWSVETKTLATNAEAVMRNGNIYQIANGYMGYRGTLDEYGRSELVAITLAGIFDRVGEAWREPVNAPNGGYTKIAVDGQALSTLTSSVSSHHQTLALRNAIFGRKTSFALGGKRVTIASERFLSAAEPHLGVIRYSISSDRDADIVLETGIDGDIWDLNGPHLPKLSAEMHGDTLVVAGITHEMGKCVAVAESAAIGFGLEHHRVDGNRNLRVVSFKAEAGKTYSFSKYFAVCTAADARDKTVPETAIAVVRMAKAQGFDLCLSAHNEVWAAKWAQSDVIIEGDDEAQHALRYSIFQLLIVAPVDGSGNSIPARALSGQVYKGAVFWDTEMFMFPFFLHTCPQKAAELLRYRIRTLDGARRKALTEGAGFRGAFYAWESQETGDDVCTYFNIGDPLTKRELRTHFRDKQVHISGDVAIAMWEYFKLTGDDSILLEGGAEVILECARFYYSYAYFKKEKNRYEILDVIGPDEYHERVNNNAFTNVVARTTFEIASQTALYLAETHPKAFKDLVQKIAITQELPLFAEAARLLFVPEPNPENGLIEQFDGYFSLRNVPVEELKSQRIHPDEYLGAGQGLAVPTQVIKQADVVMMLSLFKERYPTAIKRANWEYYEPRTEHGSSLSACAYAMVAAEFENLEFAYKYFLKTARLDLDAKYKVYVGTVFMSGSHPAANGGAWMTAVFGFGGVNANAEQVTISPRLYKSWRSLHFKLTYKGDSFDIHITHDSVAVMAEASNQQTRRFCIWGQTALSIPGKRVIIDRAEKVA